MTTAILANPAIRFIIRDAGTWRGRKRFKVVDLEAGPLDPPVFVMTHDGREFGRSDHYERLRRAGAIDMIEALILAA